MKYVALKKKESEQLPAAQPHTAQEKLSAPEVHAPAYTGGEGMGGMMDDMMRAKMETMLRHQIPVAEREADDVAKGINATTPEEVKAALGERMDADFSEVRFHTGANAAAKAADMGARAYTTGSDVYFGEGGFDASVAAHELVHTAQQGAVESGMETASAPMGGVQMLPSFKDFRRGVGNLGIGLKEGLSRAGRGIASIPGKIKEKYQAHQQAKVDKALRLAQEQNAWQTKVNAGPQSPQEALQQLEHDGRSGEYDNYVASRTARGLDNGLLEGSHEMRLFLRDTYGMDETSKDDIHDMYTNPARRDEYLQRIRGKVDSLMGETEFGGKIGTDQQMITNAPEISAKTTDIMALSDIVKDNKADLGYSDQFISDDFGPRRQYMMGRKALIRSKLREATGDAAPGSTKKSAMTQQNFGSSGEDRGYESFRKHYLASQKASDKKSKQQDKRRAKRAASKKK